MSKPKSPRQRAKTALKTLISQAGNRGRLARIFGTDRATPYRWDVLPEQHLAVATLRFGMKPEEIRPDLSPVQITEALRDAVHREG